MAQRCPAGPFLGLPADAVVQGAGVQLGEDVTFEGPCFLGEDVVVSAGARIGRGTVIGARCHIGPRAVIENAILWQGSQVGDDAELRQSVVAERCRIGPHASVSHALLGRDTTITAYSRHLGVS